LYVILLDTCSLFRDGDSLWIETCVLLVEYYELATSYGILDILV